jgi:hypothetical protein
MELTVKLVLTGKTIAVAMFLGTVAFVSMRFGMQQVGDGAVSMLLMGPALLGVVGVSLKISVTWKKIIEQAV